MVETVKIYKPSKTAMSSGRAKTKRWLLVFNRKNTQYTEPVMQWTGSSSTDAQVRLTFATKEEAVSFAEKKQWKYQLIEPHDRSVKPKSYSSNFTCPIVK